MTVYKEENWLRAERKKYVKLKERLIFRAKEMENMRDFVASIIKRVRERK
jgi:hypothetical protein